MKKKMTKAPKFLPLLLLLALSQGALGGVGVVTREVEARALALWQKHCGEPSSEGGTEGSSRIYCKRARGKVQQNLQHNVELGSKGPGGGEQVVFVQPPSYHYKHDVVVTGGGVSQRKVVVYVKPSKNTHQFNVRDQTQPGQGSGKPQVFFLKGSHGGQGPVQQEHNNSQGLTTPPPTYLPPPPSTPPPTYLPPPTKPGYNYPVPARPLRYGRRRRRQQFFQLQNKSESE